MHLLPVHFSPKFMDAFTSYWSKLDLVHFLKTFVNLLNILLVLHQFSHSDVLNAYKPCIVFEAVGEIPDKTMHYFCND